MTFTLAIDPVAHGLTLEKEPKLALATAVAVIEALGQLGFGRTSLGIRWPNDIEVDGRKLGGILPEPLETSQGHRILIGVGVNVLTSLANAPDEVRPMATSLADVYAKPINEESLPRLLSSILSHFESVLIRLINGDPTLVAYWNRLDLLRDQWVRVDLGTRIVAGLGRGVDSDGALCLDDGRQQIRLVGGQVLRTDEFAGKRGDAISTAAVEENSDHSRDSCRAENGVGSFFVGIWLVYGRWCPARSLALSIPEMHWISERGWQAAAKE